MVKNMVKVSSPKIKNEKLVSLILPIYNINHDYLKKCVNSILNQTYSNLEIILVNDGSKNNIDIICNDYEKKDSRIKIIKQQNSGVSIARNNGIINSSGEYICFIDPDDWIEKEYVEFLVDTIEKTNSDFAMCSCIVNYNNRSIINKFLKVKNKDLMILERNDKNLLLYQLIGKKICDYYPSEVAGGVPWAKIFKRKFIVENKLRFIPKMVRMQDNIFCLYAIQYASKISYIDKPLYNYRKEEGSACYKYSPRIFEFFEKYFDETFIFLNKFNKEKVLYDALYMKELTSFNSFLSQNIFNKNNNKPYNERIAFLNKKLEEERYKIAINKINYKLLNNQEKIFVFCLKNRLFLIIKILIKVRNLKKF